MENEQLNEKHLRPETLKGLILPNVDVDTYTPKIQGDSVVVVFRVKENYDAAYDLSSFIEKLPFDLLDTEAQEIPTADGHYEVFCEFERNETFPKNLLNTLGAIEQLGEVIEWKGKFYEQEEEIGLDLDILEQNIRLVPAKQIDEFLEYSTAEIWLCESGYRLENGRNVPMYFNNAKFVSEDQVLDMIKEGWSSCDQNAKTLFSAQYDLMLLKEGILAERNGTYMLFK